MSQIGINPLTTKNYNFVTYVQASFSWLKRRNFRTKTMFSYSFWYTLQESGVKIEFGPVGNPMLRQIWRKVPKNREFFFSYFFFEPKEYWGSILTMINGDRNTWTAKKKLSHRSQIAIPFAKWRISSMLDMQFWKPHDFRETVLRSFWGRWLWIWHRIFGIQNGGPNMVDIIFWKPNDFRGTLYSRAFEVADYEFDIGFPFFKMTDPIRRTWNFGNFTQPDTC